MPILDTVIVRPGIAIFFRSAHDTLLYRNYSAPRTQQQQVTPSIA